MFHRFARSGAKLEDVGINEDVEQEMRTIAGDYPFQKFMDKLDFFLEILSQSTQNPSICLAAEIRGEKAVVTVYPKMRIVQFVANSELRNGENYVSIGLDDLVDVDDQENQA